MGKTLKADDRVVKHFKSMWDKYITLNEEAPIIANLLGVKDPMIENDHIALRSFSMGENSNSIGMLKTAEFYEQLGYNICGQYEFKEKKLSAIHLEHSGPYPLVFISELKVREFSTKFQKLFSSIGVGEDFDFSLGGRPWPATYEIFCSLLKESEYGAWLYAWGFVPNHFTISVNQLRDYEEISEVNESIKERGFQLNQSGGEIKGTPSDYLEQSSTLAYEKNCPFSDGLHLIPSCYYEFAKRYPLPNGDMFTGFLTKSADKIFESTDIQQ